MSTTKQILLAKRPKGMPTENDFRIQDVDVPPLEQGQLLLQLTYVSVETISG